MIIPRRDFLNLLGITAGSVGLGGCSNWMIPDSRVAMALRGPGLESEALTICGLCPGGCGLSVRMVDGLPVGLKGNPNHPLNRGGLCPVGLAGLEVLYAPSRLQGPQRKTDSGGHEPVSWDDALSEIAGRLAQLRSTDQAHRIALITGDFDLPFLDLSRQFMGHLGSPNLAHASNPNILGYRLAQGLTETPSFDLGEADLVFSFGLDLFEDGSAPIHAITALVGNRSTENRCSLLHVGSRLSPSANKAEIFVPIQPGTHGAFALGVAHVLTREGRYNREFVARHTFGFEDWQDQGQTRLGFHRMLRENYYPDRVAQICGCQASDVVSVARRFADAERPLALAGGDAVETSNSTWNLMAIHSLNALTGSFNRPGGILPPPQIPLTPLPRLPRAPSTRKSLFQEGAGEALFGTDPLDAMANHILTGSGQIEVLLLVNANPVHQGPAGRRLREALAQVPLVVSISTFMDETSRLANYVLPAPTFLEGWQTSSTPEGVAISVLGLAKPIVEPLFDTHHPGDILIQLAERATPDEREPLPWESYRDYLVNRLEGLAASGQGSVIEGTFEESWRHFLEERGWRFLEQGGVENFWKEMVNQTGWSSRQPTPGDWARLFQTPSGRYEFFSQTLRERLREFGTPPNERPGEAEALANAIASLSLEATADDVCLPHYEPPQTAGEGELTMVLFRPITARGSQSTVSPMVMEMFGHSVLTGWRTWAELSEETARDLSLEDGDIVAVESAEGSIEAVVRVQPGAPPGVVHVPIGLGHEDPKDGTPVGANPFAAVMPVPDSLAGLLTNSSTRVRLRLVERRPHGGPRIAHSGGEV